MNQPEVKEVALDNDDTVRLENIQLKEKNAELELGILRRSYFNYLISKYHIDVNTHVATVDAVARKIVLTSK